MNKKEIFNIAQSQLAIDLNCSPDDLSGEKDSYVFTEVRNNPGRRPFPRSVEHFEMLSMGKSIVVSATPAILDIVKHELFEKGREEGFSMPFVYGHSLYYLPDLDYINKINAPDGFTYEVVEQDNIPSLYQFEGFRNALQYDKNHPRPDILAMLAKKEGRIIGMAGASNDCAEMWQLGMDVLTEYRNYGLAAYLINSLTHEILNRGYVPYYGTAPSNIASQRVAHRAGYCPAWVCAYKGLFEGMELSPTS